MVKRRARPATESTASVGDLERDAVGHVLLHGRMPPRDQRASTTGSRATAFGLVGSGRLFRDAWLRYRDELLAAWVREFPGTRPVAWWRLESPADRRQHVGGSGRVVHGEPTNGRRDDFGLPRLTDVDWSSNPPVFESEASYLRRHDLLFPGEASRLGPDDFAASGLEEEPK